MNAELRGTTGGGSQLCPSLLPWLRPPSFHWSACGKRGGAGRVPPSHPREYKPGFSQVFFTCAALTHFQTPLPNMSQWTVPEGRFPRRSLAPKTPTGPRSAAAVWPGREAASRTDLSLAGGSGGGDCRSTHPVKNQHFIKSTNSRSACPSCQKRELRPKKSSFLCPTLSCPK